MDDSRCTLPTYPEGEYHVANGDRNHEDSVKSTVEDEEQGPGIAVHVTLFHVWEPEDGRPHVNRREGRVVRAPRYAQPVHYT